MCWLQYTIQVYDEPEVMEMVDRLSDIETFQVAQICVECECVVSALDHIGPRVPDNLQKEYTDTVREARDLLAQVIATQPPDTP